jgi:hypothetical protein
VQDLAHHLIPDPSSTVSVVMVTTVAMVAVASHFDEPQHSLCATEEASDLPDVHVRLALYSAMSYE